MRMMMKVSIPVEAGNRGVKEGILPKTVMGFVEQMKPEACYFTPEGGKRTAFFFFDLTDPTMIPTAAEPFFMKLTRVHRDVTGDEPRRDEGRGREGDEAG